MNEFYSVAKVQASAGVVESRHITLGYIPVQCNSEHICPCQHLIQDV
jgi:hypothetical protein